MSNVFIAFQKNEETRAIVDAIVADNPQAIVNQQPAMVKIDAPGRLVIRKSSIEQEIGREFDLQEMHVHLITLSGNIDETDDELSLTWNQ
ncbi:monooxygenase [Alicycliphilus denitrificans]|jgi:phenol hydroxylase P2 protein|uniref:Monooxygenase component MmoB/DmpM n=2 Tax=Alicycliphilus denitrificans TaxID=179636 RepID=F4GEI5_ALIDK|nr:MmoB/DmpM family protein [Alicycliphilus denitrificans]GAO21642.1 monooxygenase component MmoB/DmpM [Alicycliphilus sp. B1]ADU98104.1 monooxygenase component MmoB/DmpM [Alicycliphilus denitrificans BC]AEB82700.1 monooxygenase component MmoB/DmpM [Alicycliphilus denitrificans K601]QKD42391.1 monooxygenase [Alicycliphilus denitrificans]GAO26006.1 monooxygenase component MmoB/DmpM [Alicycliphilus sp. B1]